MHVHVLPSPGGTVSIVHQGCCYVFVVVEAHLRRVVRLAHSLEAAKAYARGGRGLWADVADWCRLDADERRAPCACGASACPLVFEQPLPPAA